jgi:hypothetical protein
VTIEQIVTEGDRRKSLAALRDRLAGELDALSNVHEGGCGCDCGPPAQDGRVVVQLTKELRAVIAELDGLPAAKGVSAVDEVAERREARRKRAAAKGKT